MARIIIHNQCPIFQFEDLVGSLHGGRITQNFHKFKPEMKFLFADNPSGATRIKGWKKPSQLINPLFLIILSSLSS